MAGVSKDYYAGHQRGLAEGEARAEARIIKLLDDPKWHFTVFVSRDPYEDSKNECTSECLCCHLLALIKGKAE